MIKKIIVSFCLLVGLHAVAQEGTASPYSFYGIGDLKFKGSVDTRAMGGLSVFSDSIHLNLQNPAHLASLKLTNFAVGATYLTTNSKSETQTEKARRTALDYLAVGIPVGKMGIGFGLIPYSSVGYKIEKPVSATNPIYSRYNGIGGVNKVFMAFGYKLTNNFNIGADIQYNFGTIETTNLRYQIGDDFIQYGTRENNLSDLQGFNVDFGLTYQTKVGQKHTFYSSATFTPESTLKLGNSRSIDIFQFLASGAISLIETQEIKVEDTRIKLPTKFSFGAGYGEVKKWQIGAEVTYINSSVTTNRFNDITGASFENAMRYTVGGYYIPNYAAYSGYFKKVVYRGGLRYENTGLVLKDKSIKDFAANIGFGLPLGGTFSNINIGLEVGKRGTKYYNLAEENYVNLSIGLSLSDKWFVKRKYD